MAAGAGACGRAARGCAARLSARAPLPPPANSRRSPGLTPPGDNQYTVRKPEDT